MEKRKGKEIFPPKMKRVKMLAMNATSAMAQRPQKVSSSFTGEAGADSETSEAVSLSPTIDVVVFIKTVDKQRAVMSKSQTLSASTTSDMGIDTPSVEVPTLENVVPSGPVPTPAHVQVHAVIVALDSVVSADPLLVVETIATTDVEMPPAESEVADPMPQEAELVAVRVEMMP
ncbi:hypothetical protein GUJ93_ZPchr0012g20834 [Zizania palustris]|uniref:Uncharacterized protein n=1 Tax=Zizania palustris TaxID=103762 RepID=A0A8J5WU40_ZIZPA|nr:hypothetical protein GUJ93_ZPchr0012g20834 [Zizania palustris]